MRCNQEAERDAAHRGRVDRDSEELDERSATRQQSSE
jgi:hypothetical protein